MHDMPAQLQWLWGPTWTISKRGDACP